jgi:cytochrome c553
MTNQFARLTLGAIRVMAVFTLAAGVTHCSRAMTPVPNNTHGPAATPVQDAPVAARAGQGPAAAQEAPQEAQTVYKQRCALCHGAHGQGDGVAAVNLRPQPRSFASEAWQQATTDEAIKTIIVRGGGAVGKSMMMPPAQDLADKTDTLAGLVTVIRAFRPSTH